MPHVVVIHDTMVLDRPELFDRGYAAYAAAMFGMSARRADAIVCPSQYTAGRLLDRFPEIPEPFVARWPVAAADGINTRFLSEEPYVVMLGATEPHKRHSLGVAAVAALRSRTDSGVRLVIVGPQGRAEQELERAIRDHDPAREWVDRRGLVPQIELDGLLGGAAALLQPSVFEGYGLPVAEAGVRGTPVVHSGLGSLAEISPSGSVREDSIDGYVSALETLLGDSRKWSERSARSRAEAGVLTTDAFARALTAALEKAVDR